MAIRFLLHGTVKDGKTAAYRDLATRAVAAAREEPGTTEYKWFLGDDGRVVNADTYVDEAAYRAHADHANELGILAEFVEIVNVESFHVFGPVSDDLRAMLEPWGALYYSQVATL
jgi:quinol monooxygenase YgiN